MASNSSLPSIAVSKCLLGRPCRYDGKSKPHQAVLELEGKFNLIPVCPEQFGGLDIPRTPSEIILNEDGSFRVVSSDGQDRTQAFLRGSEIALEEAKRNDCVFAILKAKSPSCGVQQVYDGTFTGTLREGMGTAARLFAEAGIPLYDENHLDELPI